MEKISFSRNVYAEAFSMIGRGFTMVAKETGRLVNKAIHRQPYIFMGVEALALMVFALVLIGNARAERDYASKQAVRRHPGQGGQFAGGKRNVAQRGERR